jgi:hypothetical protein
MRSATPAVSSACVIPGTSFTTNVRIAHTISIAIAAIIPRSKFFIDLPFQGA